MTSGAPAGPPESSHREDVLAELIEEILAAEERGDEIDARAVVAEHPSLALELEAFFDAERGWERMANDLAHSAPALAAGRRVGDYVIEEELARGGMGVVFRARHVRLDRVVALKMVLTGFLATEEDLERFHREVRVLASIDHPGIVPMFEVGEHEGLPWFATKFVAGGTLHDQRARFRAPRAAAALVADVAEAVDAAHRRGILHRDLKPANILIDVDDAPRVTDFGLAKELDRESGLTRSRATLGTPSYMAPEQVHGGSRVGVPADVYSLGAVLYELLTRRPPFEAESSAECLRRVREEPPVPPRRVDPSVPTDLETIVLKCLEKEAERRYASASDLAADLHRFLRDEPILARPIPVLGRVRRWCRRNPMATALVGVLLLAALVSTASAIVISKQLGRTQVAEADGRERLRESLLAQGRAGRLSRNPGRRAESLAALAGAAEIRPGLDVRNEVIATLGLFDLVEEPPWKALTPDSTAVTALPDHDLYAHADIRGQIEVRSLTDHRVLAQFTGLPVEVSGLRFADGDRLLLARQGLIIRTGPLLVWDWRAGTELFRTEDEVLGHAYSFDEVNDRLVVGAGEDAFRILDTEEWQELARYESPIKVVGIRVAPGGERVAIFSDTELVQIWDLEAGEILQTLAHDRRVYDVAWHPDGRTIATGCVDNGTRLFDAATGELVREFVGHDSAVVGMAFDGTGDRLLTNSYDGSSRVWDVASGEELIRGRRGFEWAVHLGSKGRAGLFHDGYELWTARLEPSAIHRSLDVPFGDHPQSVDIDPERGLVASASGDAVWIWNLRTGRMLAALPLRGTHSALLRPEGLVTSGEQGLYVWPLAMTAGSIARLGPPREVHGPENYPQRVAIAEDGTAILNRRRGFPGLDSLVLHLADPAGKEPSLVLSHSGVHSVAITPDARWAASGSWNGYDILAWDLTRESPEPVVVQAGHFNSTVTFSPRGTWLVGADSRQYHLWRVGTWELEHVLLPRTQLPRPVAFAPDESLLAALDGENGIVLIDPVSGEELARVRPPNGRLVYWLTISSDGRWLGAASKNLHLWDLTGLRRELGRHRLDWSESPLAPEVELALGPQELQVDLGVFLDPARWPEEVDPRIEAAAFAALDALAARDDVEAFRLRGQLNQRRGAYLLAASDYSRAIEAGDEAVLADRARALAAGQLWGEALVDLERLVELNPDDSALALLRALCLRQVGEWEACEAALRAILTRGWTSTAAAVELTFVLTAGPIAQRNPQDAREVARGGLLVAPHNPVGHLALSLAELRCGDPEAAEAEAAKALALGVGDACAAETVRALAHQARGDSEAAVGAYERARALAEEGATLWSGDLRRALFTELRAALSEASH